MPRLRTVRNDKEAAAVPEDQPISVLIEAEPEAPPEDKAKGAQDGQQEEKVAAEPQKDERRQGDIVQEAPPEDDNEGLKKQLEELRQAEQAAQDLAAARQRELDEFRKRSKEQEGELAKSRDSVLQAQLDALVNGLTAAQAELDAAERDEEAADTLGDNKLKSDARRRGRLAAARLVQYEDAKVGLEARIEEVKKAPVQETRIESSDPIERAVAGLPSRAQDWLRNHKEYLTNPRKNAQIQFLHHESVAQGNEAFSQPYFDWIEIELGMKARPKSRDNDDDDDQSSQREEKVIPAAPVSRESPSLRDGRPVTSRITLSPAQREAARIAGISEVEYAKQLIKLHEAKKEGRIQ